MLPPPALLAIGLLIGFIVLLPARRLQLAGFAARSIGAYAAILWILGFALAVRPVGTRFLIPILLVAYVAPFIVAPERLARVVRRGRPGGSGGPAGLHGPTVKNVTPLEPASPSGEPPSTDAGSSPQPSPGPAPGTAKRPPAE